MHQVSPNVYERIAEAANRVGGGERIASPARIDTRGRGFIDLGSFCQWIKEGEREAGTPIGLE